MNAPAVVDLEASQLLDDMAKDDPYLMSLDNTSFNIDVNDTFRQSKRMTRQQLEQKDVQRQEML